MEEKIKLVVKVLGEERVKLNEKIASYTYLRQGGEALGFYIATTSRELINVLNILYDLKIPFILIGGGTKILFNDGKIKAFVIKNRSSAIKIAGIKGSVGKGRLGVEEILLEVDSGVSINKLNEYLSKQGFEEISGFSSVQSTIGGALFFDLSLRERIQKIKVWDDKETLEIDLKGLDKKQVILSAVFKFKSVSKRNII